MVGSYEGKVVIITGSSAGIGQAGAVLFAKAGASVTIHGRSEEKLQQTIQLIEKAGGSKSKILTVVGEVTDRNVQKNLIDKTVERFGKIDVLINNAGIQKKPGEEQRSMDNLDYVIEVNLKAPIAIIELAIPHLEKTKGNIINVSSIGGQKTVPPFPYYSIAKAGLNHAGRNYAEILSSKGIRVNTLSPGATDSEFATRHGLSDADYKTVSLKTINITMKVNNFSFEITILELFLFNVSLARKKCPDIYYTLHLQNLAT